MPHECLPEPYLMTDPDWADRSQVFSYTRSIFLIIFLSARLTHYRYNLGSPPGHQADAKGLKNKKDVFAPLQCAY